jgi:hypothetical protein
MCWLEPFVPLRAPKIFHLRRDPFERADENSNTYWDWMITHVYIIYAMQAVVAQQIENFRKFPPRQKPASFNLDAVLRTLVDASGAANHRFWPPISGLPASDSNMARRVRRGTVYGLRICGRQN